MIDEHVKQVFFSKPPGAILLKAVQTFLRRDSYLLEIDANERSITCQLARYLAEDLPQFDIDCEYNRDGIEPKTLRYRTPRPDEDDSYGRTVFPDIIVHRRGTNNNYLVIEMKKDTNPDDRGLDLEKLTCYRQQLSYQYAVFLELATGSRATVLQVIWI